MKSDHTNKIIELTEYYVDQRDRLVKRYSYRAGGPANAEDVVQEAFARALRYIDSYQPEVRPLPAWFNTILNNAWHDFRKEERDQGMIRVDEDVIDNLDNEVFKSELVEKLIAEIDGMKEPASEILRRFILLGYTAKEVVQSSDLNIHTVRKCIADYYKSVRERFPYEIQT